MKQVLYKILLSMSLTLSMISLAWSNTYSITESFSLKIIDINNPNDPNLKEAAALYNVSPEIWLKERDEIGKELQAGFVEESAEPMRSLEAATGDQDMGFDADFLNVKTKLSFEPKLIPNFKSLLFQTEKTMDESYLNLSTLYESPYGKLLIKELDLSNEQGTVFVTSNLFNTKIGNYPATLHVRKGNDIYTNQELFETTISWYNNKLKRRYEIVINKNLNDTQVKTERENLIQTLAMYYGQ